MKKFIRIDGRHLRAPHVEGIDELLGDKNEYGLPEFCVKLNQGYYYVFERTPDGQSMRPYIGPVSIVEIERFEVGNWRWYVETVDGKSNVVSPYRVLNQNCYHPIEIKDYLAPKSKFTEITRYLLRNNKAPTPTAPGSMAVFETALDMAAFAKGRLKAAGLDELADSIPVTIAVEFDGHTADITEYWEAKDSNMVLDWSSEDGKHQYCLMMSGEEVSVFYIDEDGELVGYDGEVSIVKKPRP